MDEMVRFYKHDEVEKRDNPWDLPAFKIGSQVDVVGGEFMPCFGQPAERYCYASTTVEAIKYDYKAERYEYQLSDSGDEWIPQYALRPELHGLVEEKDAATFAADIAQKAAELIAGDRDRQHGAKRDNFERIARLWNAWLDIRKAGGGDLTGHDVGVMMGLLKIARTQSGALNIDDYVDGVGYIACAGELAE